MKTILTALAIIVMAFASGCEKEKLNCDRYEVTSIEDVLNSKIVRAVSICDSDEKILLYIDFFGKDKDKVKVGYKFNLDCNQYIVQKRIILGESRWCAQSICDSNMGFFLDDETVRILNLKEGDIITNNP